MAFSTQGASDSPLKWGLQHTICTKRLKKQSEKLFSLEKRKLVRGGSYCCPQQPIKHGYREDMIRTLPQDSQSKDKKKQSQVAAKEIPISQWEISQWEQTGTGTTCPDKKHHL